MTGSYSRSMLSLKSTSEGNGAKGGGGRGGKAGPASPDKPQVIGIRFCKQGRGTKP